MVFLRQEAAQSGWSSTVGRHGMEDLLHLISAWKAPILHTSLLHGRRGMPTARSRGRPRGSPTLSPLRGKSDVKPRPS